MADEWADFRRQPAPAQAATDVGDPWAEFRSSGGTRTEIGADGRPRVIMDMSNLRRAQDALNVGEDVAKSAGIGVVKGGIGTVGAAGDVRELLSYGVDFAAQKLGISPQQAQAFKDAVYEGVQRSSPAGNVLANAPTSHDIQGKIEGVTGEFYKPQTTYGEVAQTVGEFAPAAIGGGGGVIAKGARVLVPALTSETAGRLPGVKGTAAEPVARFLGALAGGGATALASRPGSAARSVANQLPEGITEPMVVRADALMQEAAQRGIRLSWPEALSQVAGRPVMTNVMRHLEASPQTSMQMDDFFAGRPRAIEGAFRNEVDNIAAVNPNPSSVGPAVGRAANETVDDVRGLINSASEPFYKNAEAALFSPAEFRAIQQIPGYKESLEAVRSGPSAWRIQHLPDNSVGVLDAVKKHFDQQAKNTGSKFNPNANQTDRATYEMAADAAKQIGVARSADYEIALEVQKQAREKFLQPLLDGPLGKLAKKDVTTQKAINALFPDNPLPNSQLEIETAVSALAKRNERAARDIVRAHAESVFNEAARDLQTGPNPAVGAKFRAAIVGNPQQGENLRAAVEALPNGQARWKGFNRLLDVLEATGNRQAKGSLTTYNQMFNDTMGAKGTLQTGAKVVANPMKFLQPIADKYDQWKLGSNLTQLAHILTDPNSAGMLRAIAGAPRNGRREAAIALRLVTYAEASKPVEQKANKNGR